MTSSTRSRRTAAQGEPPAADGRIATDTAAADPATAPDRFTEIVRALGPLSAANLEDAATGPLPPRVEAGVLAVAAAGWSYNQAITHLFSYDTPAGVWVFVNNVGWNRLSAASESGVTAMIAIATMATHDNLPANYHEDAAGLIDQIYV
jgi:hypothetical protein